MKFQVFAPKLELVLTAVALPVICLAMPVRTLDDLLAINADDTEEELRAFRVAEGVAVVIAGDGLRMLFEP